jgi:hypothetical protein
MRIVENSILSLTLLMVNQLMAVITPRISQIQEIEYLVITSFYYSFLDDASKYLGKEMFYHVKTALPNELSFSLPCCALVHPSTIKPPCKRTKRK